MKTHFLDRAFHGAPWAVRLWLACTVSVKMLEGHCAKNMFLTLQQWFMSAFLKERIPFN